MRKPCIMLIVLGYIEVAKIKTRENLLRVYIPSLYDASREFEPNSLTSLRITARRNVPEALLRDYSVTHNL